MMSTQSAITTIRRALNLSLAVRLSLSLLVLVALVIGPLFRPQGDVFGAVIVLLALWGFLIFRSVKASRLNADFPELVATGQYDAAETQLETSLRSFSLFRPAKLVALHQLAVLRHAQERYGDAAALTRELLQHRLGRLNNLLTSSRLILAQSSLELGDLPAAGQALSELSRERRLEMGESMNVLALQLDYQSRIGAWNAMMTDWMPRVQLAEVMPSAPAAVTQALIALAAKKIGRRDISTWLADRAALLADVEELAKQRPLLAELWPAGAGIAQSE